MNEAEKERLIKKDIESIENRVRHAFNQGYEMGMKDREKLNCTDCIIEKSGDFIKSRSEFPNTCEDAISRQAAIKAIEALQRPIMREESNYYQFKFSGMSEAREAVVNLPSVTPQQRMGRWIVTDDDFVYCSECEDSYYPRPIDASWHYCPHCGAKMEVEE